MAHATSADGTLIAYYTVGEGEASVLGRTVVPESHDHSIDPAGTAREICRRLAA